MPDFDVLSAQDVRRCFQLVDECRQLGADVIRWETHLIERCRDLFHAQVVIGGNMKRFGAGGPPTSLSTIRVGWPDAAAELAWRQYVSDVPIEHTPEYARLTRFDGPVLTLTRDEIWDSDIWYRSRTYNERHRASGIDHYIISLYSAQSLDLCHSLWLHRMVGEKPFEERERVMLEMLHVEVGKLIGGQLAAAGEPGLRGLTRRQLEVLDLLLGADGEKQIAARLGLSRTTVHEYIAGVYRHFGVTSRPELMARFIGRARPALCRDDADAPASVGVKRRAIIRRVQPSL